MWGYLISMQYELVLSNHELDFHKQASSIVESRGVKYFVIILFRRMFSNILDENIL